MVDWTLIETRADAEAVAAASPPEQSAFPLVRGSAFPGFDEAPAESGIEVFAGLAAQLSDVLAAARADGIDQYGYAEHIVTTTYLGTSAGVRHRHVQPAGHLTVTAKDSTASTWAGVRSLKIIETAATSTATVGASEDAASGPIGSPVMTSPFCRLPTIDCGRFMQSTVTITSSRRL